MTDKELIDYINDKLLKGANYLEKYSDFAVEGDIYKCALIEVLVELKFRAGGCS